MTKLRPVPRNLEAEALYWLGVAKRVLGGKLRPDEALHALKLGARYRAAPRGKGVHKRGEGWRKQPGDVP